MADEKAALKLLNKLRRLPGNKQCASCNETCKNPMGYSNICVKFKIFVCSICKSAHQSYSHRVKHSSMSTFSLSEVESFRYENGGGNDAARELYFGGLPDGFDGWPAQGDLKEAKKFIDQAYNELRFKGRASKSHKKKKRKEKKKKRSKQEKAGASMDEGVFGSEMSDDPFGGFGGSSSNAVPAGPSGDEGDLFGGFGGGSSSGMPAGPSGDEGDSIFGFDGESHAALETSGTTDEATFFGLNGPASDNTPSVAMQNSATGSQGDELGNFGVFENNSGQNGTSSSAPFPSGASLDFGFGDDTVQNRESHNVEFSGFPNSSEKKDRRKKKSKREKKDKKEKKKHSSTRETQDDLLNFADDAFGNFNVSPQMNNNGVGSGTDINQGSAAPQQPSGNLLGSLSSLYTNESAPSAPSTSMDPFSTIARSTSAPSQLQGAGNSNFPFSMGGATNNTPTNSFYMAPSNSMSTNSMSTNNMMSTNSFSQRPMMSGGLGASSDFFSAPSSSSAMSMMGTGSKPMNIMNAGSSAKKGTTSKDVRDPFAGLVSF
jgi:hypothetical protein